jgi:hypothetical protein
MTDLITLPRATVQQALEFVTSEQWGTIPYMDSRVYEDAARLRDALRAALEQPVQVPVAINCKAKRDNGGVCPHHNLQCGWPDCNKPQRIKLEQPTRAQKMRDAGYTRRPTTREISALEQPEQDALRSKNHE